MENEHREKRAEIQRLERRLAQKEETLERRVELMEGRERQLSERDASISAAKREADELLQQQRNKLQELAGLSREEARALFLKTVEDESRHEAAKLMREDRGGRPAGRRAQGAPDRHRRDSALFGRPDLRDDRLRGSPAERRDERPHHRPRGPQYPGVRDS